MASDDARAWREAGREALRRGKPGQAVRAFDRSLALSDDPAVRVLRARAIAHAGDRERGLLELRAIAARGPDRARVDAARELVALGAVLDGITVAEDVLARTPRDSGALEVMLEAARLGWIHESGAALDALAEIARGHPTVQLRMAARFETLRDDEGAMARADAALRANPTAVEGWLVLARSAARAGSVARAREAAARASMLAGHEPARLFEAALARLHAGDVEGAERDLRRVTDLAPHDRDARAWLAELALWRLDLETAERLSAPHDAEDSRWARIRGAVHVVRGAVAEGLALLDRALEASPTDGTAHHWRGEALRRLARHDEAVEALDLAVVHSRRYAVTAHAQRLLALAEAANEGATPFAADVHAELVRALAPLAGPPDDAVLAGEPAAVARHLRAALDALGGNRSDLPTRLDGSVLTAVPVRPNSRTAARYQQELLRTRAPEDVLSGFDRLATIYGDLPTIHCHRGEVLLWLGRFADAEACFAGALAIDQATRWAWIGLGASRMFGGDLEGAERAFADALVHAPPAGRTIYVYRGELALRRDRLAAARADLEHALHINPERLSAQLLLASVDAREGLLAACRDRVDGARAVAPGLLHDAERHAGSDDPPALVTAALHMMRGNRSAGFVTYLPAAGRMRFVPPPRTDAVRHDR